MTKNNQKGQGVFLCANYESNHPMIKGKGPRESYTCVGCTNWKPKVMRKKFVLADGSINCLNVKEVSK